MHGGDPSSNTAIVTASSRDADRDTADALLAVRSRGRIHLSFKHAGVTTIDDFYQAGCLRLRLPRLAAGTEPCAVILNTAGGLADGDRLDQQVAWGDGTHAVVTTAAAEKVYRALGDGACVETRLDVGARATGEWLPQETILFDRARLARSTRVTMAEDSGFLGVEAVVFGRTAMAEEVETGALRDAWRIWRGGRLVYADTLHLEGPVSSLLDRAAIGGGARAMAVLIHISTRAASLLGELREALAAGNPSSGGTAVASAWNGMLVVRLLARDGGALRRDVLRALAVLRDGRPMPRLWNC